MEERIEFRPIISADRDDLLAIAAQIWEGHDYLPQVFDRWVSDPRGYFAAMVLEGRLIGCGRLFLFDARRGWLEGLRIDPCHQGRKLGQRMARHVVDYARRRGVEELSFATYFRNHGSIHISELAGFRRTAIFTNLELHDITGALRWAASVDCAGLEESPVLPEIGDTMSNDWFFVPAGVPDRAGYFPAARLIRQGRQALMAAPNTKVSDCLEICWVGAPAGDVGPACLAGAIQVAREGGFGQMHVMAPAKLSLARFLEAGFVYQEEPNDVYLYGARVSELRMPEGNESPAGAGPPGDSA
ncbi:MAG: GNAT family N-acetyltransferase [Candidatus Eisenbacteria bacterium]